jgi:hypothetical protein
MFRQFILGITLATTSLLAIPYVATAQTTNPELNNLLNRANEAASEAEQLVNEVEQQLQQEEAYWTYYCNQGYPEACQQLQLFYQRRMRGYEAGIQYWEQKRNSGWADSFGY